MTESLQNQPEKNSTKRRSLGTTIKEGFIEQIRFGAPLPFFPFFQLYLINTCASTSLYQQFASANIAIIASQFLNKEKRAPKGEALNEYGIKVLALAPLYMLAMNGLDVYKENNAVLIDPAEKILMFDSGHSTTLSGHFCKAGTNDGEEIIADQIRFSFENKEIESQLPYFSYVKFGCPERNL